MTESSRDRISVDLRGLKPGLLESAQARGVSPSEFVRQALAVALGVSAPPLGEARNRLGLARVRIGLRLEEEPATALRTAARAAGLSAGDFVTSLLADAPRATADAKPAEQAAALTASCSALTTLSRDLRHLTLLLSQGDVAAAREYRDRLDGVRDELRAHLRLASAVLAELRHLRRAPAGHSDTRAGN